MAEDILLPGARLVIITFHSLEDRMVKVFFNKISGKQSNLNRHLPEAINRKKIINSVGAGDAFCAAFIYGVHESWDMKKILKKAHGAGSAMMKIDSSSGNLPNIKKL